MFFFLYFLYSLHLPFFPNFFFLSLFLFPFLFLYQFFSSFFYFFLPAPFLPAILFLFLSLFFLHIFDLNIPLGETPTYSIDIFLPSVCLVHNILLYMKFYLYLYFVFLLNNIGDLLI